MIRGATTAARANRNAELAELRAEIEQLRGCLWDCRALIRGELSGYVQRHGVLKWADDLLGEEGLSDD